MRAILRALKTMLARARFERDMREELRFHVERRADDLAAAGMTRDARRAGSQQAHRAARISGTGTTSSIQGSRTLTSASR